MAVNRLFSKKNSRRSRKVAPICPPSASHEAIEVSLCDRGMCLCSQVQHAIGAVLLVDFAADAEETDRLLQSEAVVVDCRPSATGSSYDITVIFTGE